MHVIVHVIPVKPDAVEQARRIFDERVPPMAERFSGWRGARLCMTDDHQLVAMGFWADEGQMKEFLAQPEFSAAMTAFSEVFAGAPTQYITKELVAVGPARS